MTLGASFVTSKTNGFVIKGSANFQLGTDTTSTCGLGDVNGDHIDDFAVSASYYNPGGKSYAGAVWVIYGQDNPATVANIDLSTNLGSAGFQIAGAVATDCTGKSIR